MGVKNLDEEILTVDDLIRLKRFDSVQSVYNMPDSMLPRVRRNGKIMVPLRFYRSDVERLFSQPARDPLPERSLKTEVRQETRVPRPSILFKKRKK